MLAGGSGAFAVLCMSKLNRLKQILVEQVNGLLSDIRNEEDTLEFLETVSVKLSRGQRKIMRHFSSRDHPGSLRPSVRFEDENAPASRRTSPTVSTSSV